MHIGITESHLGCDKQMWNYHTYFNVTARHPCAQLSSLCAPGVEFRKRTKVKTAFESQQTSGVSNWICKFRTVCHFVTWVLASVQIKIKRNFPVQFRPVASNAPKVTPANFRALHWQVIVGRFEGEKSLRNLPDSLTAWTFQLANTGDFFSNTIENT